jgi:hypothetical protein
MIVGVTPNLMTFSDNSPNETRVFLRVHAHEEKGGLNAVRFKDIENPRRPLRVGAVIEGQGDLMLTTCALVIKSREFGKTQIARLQMTIFAFFNFPRSVRARFVDADNLALAHVGDGVRAFEGV